MAASPSGVAATTPGPTSASTSPTRSSAPKRRATTCRSRCSTSPELTCAKSSGTSRTPPAAARWGAPAPARARRLVAEEGLEKLPLEAVGWLLPVLSGDANSSAEVAAIRRLLNNRAEEAAATAHFTPSYGDDDSLLLHSSRRADGVILEALIGDQPQSDLIPKLARGLLAHRTKGRWENTQENAFDLLALDRYFQTYEKPTPDLVARAWLGDA